MSFKITITETYDEPNTLDDGTTSVTREIYAQSIDTIDVKAVFHAVNNPPKRRKRGQNKGVVQA